MVFRPHWARRLLLRPCHDPAKSARRDRTCRHVLQGRSTAGPTERLEAGIDIDLGVDFNETPEQFENALQRYRQATDKSWSLTDCASFGIMDDERIRAALTYDKHFTQAGYEALLR